MPVHEPHILERKHYDKVMENKFNRHITPAQLDAELIKAVIIFKRRAHHVHTYCEKKHKGTRIAHMFSSHKPHVNHHGHEYSGHGAGEEDVEGEIEIGRALLAERLEFLRLAVKESLGDGNCQFRSISQELYGTQDHHVLVREKAIAHMVANAGDYSLYFDSEDEWQDYLLSMSTPMTWGDELTLRATCDGYGVKVHVITTTKENWYLHYEPKKRLMPRAVFICYTAPIHYDTFVALK
jgi:hypothetical protein